MGYPGIVLDDSGNRVQGFIFTSVNLPNHWDVLDEFEGAEYERRRCRARCDLARREEHCARSVRILP